MPHVEKTATGRVVRRSVGGKEKGQYACERESGCGGRQGVCAGVVSVEEGKEKEERGRSRREGERRKATN